MINLIRAEWKKLLGNRMLASFTVWLYPTGLGAFILVMSIIHLLGGDTYQELGGNWNEPMLAAWNLITQFPDASLGRLPLLAFMAVMSAGEYEWGTWKNILPRNRRWAILVAKILTMALVMVFAIGLTSIISGPIRYAAANLIGIQTAPPLTSSDLPTFWSAYALEAGIAFFQSLFLALFAVFCCPAHPDHYRKPAPQFWVFILRNAVPLHLDAIRAHPQDARTCQWLHFLPELPSR